jgi:hypothetical protein
VIADVGYVILSSFPSRRKQMQVTKNVGGAGSFLDVAEMTLALAIG